MYILKKGLGIGILLGILILGCFLAVLGSSNASNSGKEAILSLFNGNTAYEVSSPANHIEESQIKVYDDRIIIELSNARWAKFTDTNSMDPVLDSESNSIEIIPLSADDVHVGDIISYRSDYASGIIVHRVIEKGEDENGTYFIAKGDNNSDQDPGKIRFEQIEGVLVAVIY